MGSKTLSFANSLADLSSDQPVTTSVMIQVLTPILMTLSANLVVVSYWTGQKSPSSLTKVVSYTADPLGQFESPLAVTISGECYAGTEMTECAGLGLGPWHT